eukprot:TRINITY_DN3697_c0_g2_i11.p1 TRINITY_DN3697_c0_g2~~TRINITY_DN3697_c0_g2_i11.p1  ORF type:complete len:242 (+),score=39.61 TRINITY_DN3697_c0_g2_i11:64-789(+)
MEASRKGSIGKARESKAPLDPKFQRQQNRGRSGSTSEYIKKKKTVMQKTFIEDAWTFYYMFKEVAPQKRVSYFAGLKRIFTIDCIEDFWNVYNYMPPLYDLLPNTDYMFFKADIRPEWEAPANKDGGKWVLTIENKDQEGLNMQDIWENLLLTMLGCTYTDYEFVNGAVISLRERYFRFALWTRNSSNKDLQLRIGKQLREIAKIPPKIQICYQVHANALKKQLDNEYTMALQQLLTNILN